MNHTDRAEQIGKTVDRIMARMPAPHPARHGLGRRILTAAAEAFIVLTWLLAVGLTWHLFVIAFVN